MSNTGALVRARAIEERSPHNRIVTMVLCWFFGIFGVHRFYVGKFGTGLLMLLTGGGFGIWWFIDFVVLLLGRFKDSEDRVLGPPQIVYEQPALARGQLPAHEPELEPLKDSGTDWDDEVMRDPLEDEFEELEKQLARK